MHRKILTGTTGILMAGMLSATLATSAQAQSSGPSTEQLLRLIQQQQKQLDEMKAALQRAQAAAEKAAVSAEEAKAAPKTALPEYLNIGGAAEIEATETEAFSGSDSSDITLAKVELFFDANPTDWLEGHVQVLYEDDGTETISLDEAWVKIGGSDEYPLFVQAGKWVVPFGNFDTAMSTDPLTKNVGETKEATVLGGVAWQGFTIQAYVYNGDTQENDDGNYIDQIGAAVDYEGAVGDAALTVGAGYISNVADSDTLTDTLGTNASALGGYVPGAEVHGAVAMAGFTVRGSYLTATKAFRSGEIAFNGTGAKPAAWHTELSYDTKIMNRDVTFAATAQGTKEALALGLAETRLGAAVTVGLIDVSPFATSITLEYLHDEDYSTTDGGTGNNGHTATVKLAAEF